MIVKMKRKYRLNKHTCFYTIKKDRLLVNFFKKINDYNSKNKYFSKNYKKTFFMKLNVYKILRIE